MTSKEIIKNKIASLEDDYQHYTMVDKDKVKAHFIKIDIEEHQQILQDLERLEELEKENQELAEALELYNEKFAGNERERADLIKENQELKARCKAIPPLAIKNEKLVKAIEKHLEKLEIFNSRVSHLRRNDICDCIDELIDRLEEVLE